MSLSASDLEKSLGSACQAVAAVDISPVVAEFMPIFAGSLGEDGSREVIWRRGCKKCRVELRFKICVQDNCCAIGRVCGCVRASHRPRPR